jgi:hypothetical protein
VRNVDENPQIDNTNDGFYPAVHYTQELADGNLQTTIPCIVFYWRIKFDHGANIRSRIMQGLLMVTLYCLLHNRDYLAPDIKTGKYSQRFT